MITKLEFYPRFLLKYYENNNIHIANAEEAVADKIKTHLLNRYNQEISAEEKAFLVIHISRLARN